MASPARNAAGAGGPAPTGAAADTSKPLTKDTQFARRSERGALARRRELTVSALGRPAVKANDTLRQLKKRPSLGETNVFEPLPTVVVEDVDEDDEDDAPAARPQPAAKPATPAQAAPAKESGSAAKRAATASASDNPVSATPQRAAGQAWPESASKSASKVAQPASASAASAAASKQQEPAGGQSPVLKPGTPAKTPFAKNSPARKPLSAPRFASGSASRAAGAASPAPAGQATPSAAWADLPPLGSAAKPAPKITVSGGAGFGSPPTSAPRVRLPVPPSSPYGAAPVVAEDTGREDEHELDQHVEASIFRDRGTPSGAAAAKRRGPAG
jgi:hypothetical protein